LIHIQHSKIISVHDLIHTLQRERVMSNVRRFPSFSLKNTFHIKLDQAVPLPGSRRASTSTSWLRLKAHLCTLNNRTIVCPNVLRDSTRGIFEVEEGEVIPSKEQVRAGW
jgi:hypothetical protein